MRVYNERSGVEFQAWFEATPGVPTVPSSVHWLLHCVTNDMALQEATAVSPEIISDETGITGVKVTIDIPGSLNAIQNDANMREVKQLLVISGMGTDREYSEVHEYYVRNVKGRT
jgi:hypothetical protein